MAATETATWRAQAAEEYRTIKADKIREALGILRQIDKLNQKHRKIMQEVQDLDAGARAFGIPTEGPDSIPDDDDSSEPENSGRSGPLFKDLALDLLKEAYPLPMRANDVKEAIEKKLGRTFHSKTPGMSLYRLSKEGLVRRQGWDWFFIPQGSGLPVVETEAEDYEEEDLDINDLLG